MSCTDVQTIQAGNGTKTQFSFDFPYIFKSEIHVYFWNATTKEWDEKLTTDATYPWQVTDANPTIVEFTSTAPPAPTAVVDPNETLVDNVRIRRETNIEDIRALFNPGSAIRSDDLNNNFEQLRYAIQESNCQGVTEDVYQYLLDNYWDRFDNTLYDGDTWVSDDTKIATSEAIDDRIDSKIDTAITSDIATDGTGITVTDDGDGTITLGLAANTIDFDRIKNSDIITQAEQDGGAGTADSNIFTALAAARRFDTLVQTSTPAGSAWETGKTWYQNDEDKTVYVWDGSGWEAITSGGAFTRLDQVIYVDATNGDDNNNGHRISTPKKTIKSALAAINSDATYGNGSTILVAPGIYKEAAPLDIQKTDVSIVGASVRNVIIHPTADTETNSLFRVNSGSYLANMTFTGVKASGTRGGTGSLWTDSEYGLPPTQGWNVSFYPDAKIYKSPYIQNCTNFSDSEIDNDALDFYTGDSDRGQAGDLDSEPTGGGLLIDGDTVHDDSPLRSMVADSYTHVALDGPGIFVTNNGYAQVTSSYAFFNHFHIGCINGGQANLAASTTDFGRFSLVASGRSTSAIFTATVNGAASSGSATFDIDNVTAGASWFGNAERPADNMLVEVGGNTYPILNAETITGGFRVTISRPDTGDRTVNLGLNGNVADNAAVSFFLRSMIASSGHTMEYVGAGTDYRALPYNATGTYTVGAGTQPNGVPIESHQVKELSNGKVWAAITDHNGKFRVGDTFSVDQQTGFVNIPAGALSVSKLLADLDVNGKSIVTNTTNEDIVLNPNGTGVVNVSTSRITNVVDPTGAQDASTKSYVDTELDNLTTSSTAELNILDGATLNTSELNILDGATLDTNELNQLDGASLTDNPTWTSTTQFPSAASINTRFLGLLNALGGFVAIADENSFPTTNPDPSDGAGTVVSIADAGGMSINASGTGTGQTTGGDTVTITGFPASFNSTTLPAQQGLQVQTTTTLNTYTYHKVIARDDDIIRLNDDVNDFFQRYRFGASNPTTDNDAGDLFFNTGSGTMLVWDTSGATAEWKEVQSIGEFFVIPASEFPTWNGTINDITITNAPANASQIILSINGVVQEPNSGTARPTDGFALDGSVIRLSDAPASGSEAWGVIIGSTVNIGEPSANTVSSDKIVDGAVIEAKLGTGSVTSGKIANDAVGPDQLADTAVTAGSYTLSSITVDAQGRITAASSGTANTDNIAEGNSSVVVTDTGSNGTIAFTTEDQRAMTIDSSQRLLVGTDSAINTSGHSRVQIVSPGGPMLDLARNDTSVIGSNEIGHIRFLGNDDNGTHEVCATIEARADGSHATGDKPTRLMFSTTASGASTPTERLRISADGSIGMGGAYDLGASDRLSFNPTDGLIGFGMNGRDSYVTSTAGCYIYSGSGSSGTTLAGELILQSRANISRDISFVTGSTPTLRARIAGSGDFQFNNGYGSVATAYGVRAWCRWNMSGTQSIYNSGNVSSLTDNGTGITSVNFTTAMPDSNYAVSGNRQFRGTFNFEGQTASFAKAYSAEVSGSLYDADECAMIVVR